MSTLLLVTGAGRSGTSTAAGALSMLGAHVPGPYLNANETNPKGFYESRWSVEFHNRIRRRVPMALTDTRPAGWRMFNKATKTADRNALKAWLVEHTRDQPLTVLKDPRTVWSIPLLKAATDELGLRLALIVMLRHPAEVTASRSSHYADNYPSLDADGRLVRDLAGWINTVTTCEQQSRRLPRAFLDYHDLLDDWRGALGKALAEIDVSLTIPDDPHPVDEFIEPGLNRHDGGWQSPPVFEQLRELSERTWQTYAALADARDGDAASEAEAAMDRVRSAYALLYKGASAMTLDQRVAQAQRARQTSAAQSPGPAKPHDGQGNPSTVNDGKPSRNGQPQKPVWRRAQRWARRRGSQLVHAATKK